MTLILAKWMGGYAWEILEQFQQAKPGLKLVVFGVTSRGVFLQASHRMRKRVLFLSIEPYLSPLTVNLAGSLDELRRLSPGDKVEYDNNLLCFKEIGLEIGLEQAALWCPASPAEVQGNADVWRQRLHRLGAKVGMSKGSSGFAPLLWMLAGEPAASFSLAPEQQVALDLMQNLIPERTDAAVKSQGASRPRSEYLTPLLGLGRGLTPSGDDVVLGMLLALNRWVQILHPNFNLKAFNTNVVRAARRRTTVLSACLIECASRGEADERLLAALDYIFTGSPNLETCAAGLCTWGSSSGADALAGMALVIAPTS